MRVSCRRRRVEVLLACVVLGGLLMLLAHIEDLPIPVHTRSVIQENFEQANSKQPKNSDSQGTYIPASRRHLNAEKISEKSADLKLPLPLMPKVAELPGKVSQKSPESKQSASATKSVDIRKWQTKCSRNKSSTIYNHTRFGLAIDETEVCLGDIFLLMFVQSKVENRDRRDMIRRTYGSLENVNNLRVRLIFVLGFAKSKGQQEEVVQESQRHRDVVQSAHMDHYRNLTYTHLSALDWIDRRCNQAKFVLKLDDDTFVNLPHLVTFMSEVYADRRNFIYCHTAAVTKPIRKKGFKWTVTKAEWPDETYPQHCKGFAYIMSRDIVKSLLHCSYYMPYFWIDDVFVSGALRHRIGANLQSFLPGFDYAWMMPHHAGEQIADYVFLVGRYNEMFKRLWQKLWKAALVTYLT